jgi:hypothetical protein
MKSEANRIPLLGGRPRLFEDLFRRFIIPLLPRLKAAPRLIKHFESPIVQE